MSYLMSNPAGMMGVCFLFTMFVALEKIDEWLTAQGINHKQ